MKKGQAAMEFLMTYGWAILVVLAAIGALAYFGVLGPTKYLPEQCIGPAGMDCIDKPAVSTDDYSISFALRNNLGYTINITFVNATDGDCDANLVNVTAETGDPIEVFADETGDIAITNEENAIIWVNCSEETFNEKVASTIKVYYTSARSGLDKSATYSIRGTAS